MEENDGNDSGPCPFTVHGITGDDYEQLPLKVLKAKAIQHLMEGGKVLAIGHSANPESLYDNPQLYPQTFPWLFPYGLGGIGQLHFKKKLSSARHKKHLLMYYDKRFQMDEHFPLIAFNHEQIKDSTTAGFVLTNKNSFKDVVTRLFAVDTSTLEKLSSDLQNDTVPVVKSEEEKVCYQIIRDLDHIGHGVNGSITNKKYMRSEIWSLVSYKGAPSWYITLSPSDEKHPICLYYADVNREFRPFIKDANVRRLMVSQNPVAGARFFHLMIQLFIKHVLGHKINIDSSAPSKSGPSQSRGFYGKTDAYYGTVEQ
ncbi:hypothetical protein BJ138DRAFT_1013889, partial [Hygrophoropsis aurantiaca]